MNKTVLIVLNVVTGLIVGVMSTIAYLFSGIGEGSTNDIGLLIWPLIWVAGVVLQVAMKKKGIGLVVTMIPVGYFAFSIVQIADMMNTGI